MTTLAALESLLNNIIRHGKIHRVDAEKYRATVWIGHETGWLPWLVSSAGALKVWHCPTVGEQVLILSPAGNIANGFILRGAFTNSNAAPENSDKKTTVVFPNGDKIDHNSDTGDATISLTGKLSANVGGDLNADVGGAGNINAGGATTIKTPSLTIDASTTTITGSLSVADAITGMGGMAVSGGSGASVTGSMTITGGDVSADGISLTSHTHTEQGDGAPTSPPQ